MPTIIIRSFGMFWERDQITWGKPGPGGAGHLRGYRTNPEDYVDFRHQRGIYILYEGADIPSQRVTYVGQAGAGQHDLFSRLRNHRDYGLWNRWQRFSWFGLLGVGNAGLKHRNKKAVGHVQLGTTLDQVEAILIELLEPIKNKQGPKWKGALEYFQVHNEASNRVPV